MSQPTTAPLATPDTQRSSSQGATSPQGTSASRRPDALRQGELGSQIQMLAPGAQPDFAEQQARLAPVQLDGPGRPGASVHHLAAGGIQGGGGPLPYAQAIQASFGPHDVSAVQAHVGGAAAEASAGMGAQAYATGNHVAFARTPDLHTAAHEAAHVVQQRAGLSLPGGVGSAGDAHERHADAVADAVVKGESAAPLLDRYAGGGGAGDAGAVQRREDPSSGGKAKPASDKKGGGGQPFTWSREREDGARTRTTQAEVARDKDGNVTGRVGQRTVIAQDDLELSSGQSLAYAGGNVTAQHEQGARYVDAETGERHASKRAVGASYGKDGAGASASSERVREQGGDKRTTRASGAWSEKDGFTGDASYEREVKGDAGDRRRIRGAVTRDKEGNIGAAFERETELAAVSGHSMKRTNRLEVGPDRVAAARAAEDAYEREGADGGTEKVKDTRRGRVAFGPKGLEAELGRERRVETEDGHRATSATASFGPDGPTAGLRDEAVKKGEGSETRTTRGVGLGKGGLTANVGRETVIGDKKGDNITTRTGASVENGNLTFERGQSAAHGTEDGGKVTSRSSGTLAVGQGGVVVGHSGGSTEKSADGGSVERSHGVTGNILAGELGAQAGVTRKDKDGNVTSGVSGGGKVKLGPGGRLDSASVEGSAQVGKVKVKGEAGINWTYGEPVKVVGDDGQETWLVEVTRTVSAGAGGGAKGVSAGGKLASTQRRTIRVTSQAELDKLLRDGPTPRQMAAVRSAADARNMAEGETSASGSERSVGAGATANIGMLKVGATISAGSSRSMEVQKVEGGKVRVVVRETSHDAYGGSVGTSVGSIGGSRTSATRSGMTLEFDLDSAEGRAAFDAFQVTGQMPRVGARLIARSEGKTEGDSVQVGLLGASATTTSTVDTGTAVDEDGNETHHAHGTRAQGISVPLLGSHHRSMAMEAEEVRGKGRTWRSRVNVESTSARDASQALAHMTGTAVSRDVSGKGSGAWTVTSHFSDAQIQRLVAKIRAGEFAIYLLAESRDLSHGRKLIDAIRAAGNDFDAIRVAFATFISRTGGNGMRVIRKNLGVVPSYDVALADDRYLRGAAVRLEIARQTSDFKARAAKGAAVRGALLADIDEAIAYHRTRAAHVGSSSNYPELPIRIRQEEVARSRKAMSEFQAIRADVAAQAKARPAPVARQSRVAGPADAFTAPTDAAASPQESLAHAFLPPQQAEEARSAEAAMSRAESPAARQRREAWDRATKAKENLEGPIMAAMNKAFDEVRLRHWLHGGAYTMAVARKELRQHSKDYERAEGLLGAGRIRVRMVEASLRGFLDGYAALERRALGGGEVSEEAARGVISGSESVTRMVRGVVAECFGPALAIYRGIERANAGGRYNWDRKTIRELNAERPDYMR